MKNPRENAAAPVARPLKVRIDGKEFTFDIEDPKLPDWVDNNKLISGGYPYDKKMKSDEYDETLERLQIELVKAQAWLQSTGKRVMSLFEGRDAAGKGGTIFVLRQYMNPRTARNVALTKPTPTETGQWYFQRYVAHFPTSGEFVTFDRSWYNRAGVEPVMGFCTPEQHEKFLDETPYFERMICNEGIHFFKFWLNIGRETQFERFHDRLTFTWSSDLSHAETVRRCASLPSHSAILYFALGIDAQGGTYSDERVFADLRATAIFMP